MQNPEKLAQEAIKSLELAQKFEEEKNIQQAILNYEKAVDFLKQSGYLMHRINDIYERVQELKDSLKKEKIYQQAQIQTQVAQLQDQAFALLEGANKLEHDGFFEEANQQYLSAINLLSQSGWSETQLENIKLKIKNINDILRKEQEIQQAPEQELRPSEEYLRRIEDIKPEVVDMFGQKSSVEKAASIARYRTRKKEEEEKQDHAFAHIDKAKAFEKERKFDQAIMNYEKAIELLNLIGWEEQTQKILLIIEKLRKDKEQFEYFQSQQEIEDTNEIGNVVTEKHENLEAELKKEKLIEFEEKKAKEELIQRNAFTLIDIGKRFEREKNYEQAIQKFEEAVELFRSIDWDSYIQPVFNLIGGIKEKQERERKAELLTQKRQKDLNILQKSIYRKQREQVLQTAKEIDSRKRKFEEKRSVETKKEKEFFNILSNADTILQQKKYDDAISEYKEALKTLGQMGPGWETYVSNINNTISNVQKIKNSQFKKQYEVQQKLEKREKAELEFQNQIVHQLKKERELIKQKEIVLKDKEKELIIFEQRKNDAFRFLDSAINSVKEADYENAIIEYQNAGNIFAEIQWQDEISLIENSILEVEELQKNQKLIEQKKLQETLEIQKEDEAFQKQIAKYLQQEREKIKKREIELKERAEELKYREERRKAGFKLLEEAKERASEGNYDEAIEILQYSITFFADAEWRNEISIIQNSILEIENKKRDKRLQEQVKLQAKLEKEKQDKIFQEQLTKDLKSRQERLKQKRVVLREREKELAYREERKNIAFNLLENAQKLVTQGNYDEVLEIYHKVKSIFAQIRWVDEIPLLNQAIQDIENKKRESIIAKQKQLQKAIKKETSERAFIEQIKYQRERESHDAFKESEFKERDKIISAQNLAQQQEAFKMIEAGENLFIEEKYDVAMKNYREAIKLLENIGWGTHYLKILNDTIDTIQEKKIEKDKAKKTEFELALKHQKEEEQFQAKVTKYLKKEQEKITSREIQIQKREIELSNIETRKSEAFGIMENAENLLVDGQYDQSIEKYRQAELILNEIGFPTEIVQDMIQKIQEKRRTEELNKIAQMELNVQKEQEDLIFQQKIVEKVRIEQLKMIEKKEELKKQENLKLFTEEMKEKAFDILESAQTRLEKGNFDDAIKLYHDAANIFEEIKWNDEIKVIQNSINIVEERKREAEIKKQKKLAEVIEQEKIEKTFQEQIARETKNQQEALKHKEIVLRNREKELAYRENQKGEAFKLLDEAQKFLSQKKYDEALEIYYKVSNIFAQIQWTDEIPIIHETILNIQNQKKENDLIKQKSLEKAIEDEMAHNKFLEKILQQKQQEKEMAINEVEYREKKKLITAQNLIKQGDAFKLIEEGEQFLKKNNFDDALTKYNNAIVILTDIGWTNEYLKLLYGTLDIIKTRKREIERKKELEQQLLFERQKEEEKFQTKIISYAQREKERLEKRQIEIQKHKDLTKLFEQRKTEAFNLMDDAEKNLNKAQYEVAINKYRQAELILSEIGFPTGAVKETINKVQDKVREDVLRKQKHMETLLQNEREEYIFQQKIREDIKIGELKTKAKQNELKKQREIRQYNERKRNEAFDLLEEAEIYLKQAQYDKSLELYYSAEIILNEIRFPTDVVREMIQKVQERKNISLLQKQRDLEFKLQKEKDEWKIQQKVAEKTNREKERLLTKKVQLEQAEQRKTMLEQRKQSAFKILDDAETFLKESQYDKAIETYRKAEYILNEVQFPTEAINAMVTKIKKIIKDKEKMEELKFQQEIGKIQEEKDLQLLIEERQRQEREKKKAQHLALQERERLIQEQMSIRESAYSLLEEGGNYLKQPIPDYDKAVSLYILARNTLSENIGWEPEINNLNALIKDIQQEQTSFHERKQLEETAQIQRQKEYEMFQEEVRIRRLEQEKLKREQERHYRELILSKQRTDQIKDEGLRLIDEGKKWVAYHDFGKADDKFKEAILKFKEIGWHEEIKYIETEINNMKALEERVNAEESRINAIQEQLESQRKREEKRKISEENKLKENIREVRHSADDIMNLIEKRREEQKVIEEEERVKVKEEAKDFRGKVGELIKIKEELLQEIERKDDEKVKFKEKLQQAKEREEVDSLKRMIKEAGKNKKK
jgi:tetratricopeptide (TPR) repeat protein